MGGWRRPNSIRGGCRFGASSAFLLSLLFFGGLRKQRDCRCCWCCDYSRHPLDRGGHFVRIQLAVNIPCENSRSKWLPVGRRSAVQRSAANRGDSRDSHNLAFIAFPRFSVARQFASRQGRPSDRSIACSLARSLARSLIHPLAHPSIRSSIYPSIRFCLLLSLFLFRPHLSFSAFLPPIAPPGRTTANAYVSRACTLRQATGGSS